MKPLVTVKNLLPLLGPKQSKTWAEAEQNKRDVTDSTDPQDKADLEALKVMSTRYGLYGVLKMLFEDSKDTCAKFAEVGNMEAVIHGDTLMLMNALKRMQSCHYSPGGAIMRQLDLFEPAECHQPNQP